MAKDPAVLFFIDKWLLATAEMKADCKSWYHSLILHQFDKKSLPNDIEELANLASVRASEFDRFKQVFEDVLKDKFKANDQGRLVNDFANEIIKNREQFKDKRSNAGKMSYFAKFMRKICSDENVIQFVLKNTDFNKLDTKNEQMLKQVFKQTSELYISVSVNTNVSVNESIINSTIVLEEPDLIFENKKSELINLLCQKLGYEGSLFSRQRSTVMAFVNSQIVDDEMYNHFINQFNNYQEYKKLSGEVEHNTTGYFGTQAMAFTNSAWNSENWELKLSNFKEKNKSQTKTQQLDDVFGQVANDMKNGHSTL